MVLFLGSLFPVFSIAMKWTGKETAAWTGAEKLYYLLDKKKKITGFRCSGMQLPNTFELLKGKYLLSEVEPFSTMPEKEMHRLLQAFKDAEQSVQAVLCRYVMLDKEQTVKISPFSVGKGEITFQVRLSVRWLGNGSRELRARAETK